MSTVILENAGETILLEGIKAQEYLDRKAKEREKAESEYDDAARHRTAKAKFNRTVNLKSEARSEADKADSDEAYKKYHSINKEHEENRTAYNKAVAEDPDNKWSGKLTQFDDTVLDNDKVYAKDAEDRHKRRHGDK